MKIIHLLNTSTFSGAENVVCQIIGMMKNYPEYEHVYCSREGQIEKTLLERNIHFVPISEMSVKELKRVFFLEKPDIIHAHDMRASFFAALACGKKTLICHIHNNAFQSRKLSIRSIAFLLAAARAKHIFWVSNSAKEGYFFRNYVERKSTVLSNIVDIDFIREKCDLDCRQYDFDVVFLGRLSKEKNPERALHIFSEIIRIKSNVKCAFIGSGDEEIRLNSLVDYYGIADNVSILGFMPNPLKILSESKVMVMTSLWEGLPMSALESLALGVPVVSTPTDGMKDIIIDGYNGFISDDDSRLVDSIMMLINDSTIQHRISEGAKDTARRLFCKTDYIAALLNEYQA